MKKILYKLLIIFLILSLIFIIILSTIGIETNKFNNLISNKINQTNNNINLKLNSIKFKVDIEEFSLFLETKNPTVFYRDSIPAKNIKVYLDFISLIKTETKIKKINLILSQIEVNKLKEISNSFQTSNFKSFVKNKILEGSLNTEIEIFLDENNLFKDFIAKGSFSNFKAKTFENLILTNTNFDFFADKSDVLIKNIFGELSFLKIKDGDLKIKLSPEIEINSNFISDIKFNKQTKIDTNFFNKYSYFSNLTNFTGTTNNSFFLIFDKTYKVKNYDITSNGKISSLNFVNKIFQNNEFLPEKINLISIAEADLKTSFTPKQSNINIVGSYSANESEFLDFKLENSTSNQSTKIYINAEFDKELNLEAINFKKPKDIIAKINLDFEKNKKKLIINNMDFIEGSNEILLKKMIFKDKKFLSLKKAIFKTKKNKKINNDFEINFGQKVLIKGTQFDATNLPKILNKKFRKSFF